MVEPNLKRLKRMDAFGDHDDESFDAALHEAVMDFQVLGKLTTSEKMFEIRCRDDLLGAGA